MNNPIDQKFKQELFDYNIEPRPELWQKIESQRKPAKPFALPKFWLAASFIGIAAFIAFFPWSELITKDENQTLSAVESPKNQNINGPNREPVIIDAKTNEENEVNRSYDMGLVTRRDQKDTKESKASPSSADIDNLANPNLGDDNSPTTPIGEVEKDETPEAKTETETNLEPEPSTLKDNEVPENIEPTLQAEEKTSIQAPEEVKEKQKTKRKISEMRGPWSIDISASPDMNSKDFRNYGSDMETYIKARENSEALPVGWSTMVRINYALTPALRINSGLRYSNIRETINLVHNNYSTQVQLNFRDGFILDPFNNPIPVKIPVYDTITVNNPFAMQSNNTYQVLDIPLGVDYRLFEYKRFSVGIQGGISFNLRFKADGYIPNTTLTGEQSLNGSGTPLNASAGLGYFGGFQVNYRLAKKLEFVYEPTLRASGPQLISNGEGYRLIYQSFSNFLGLRFNL